MNLKKIGKRILYIIGGIVLFFVTLVLFLVDLKDGGEWLTTYRIYLCIGIIFGLGLFITGFQKNIDGTKKSQKMPAEKSSEPGSK